MRSKASSPGATEGNTMHAPRVSVCVPTRNGGAFLRETLESVAAQTFEDLEVVIVDDGSTDDTVAIAREHAARDARIRIFEAPDRAGSSARNANRCLTYALGEWIKFIFQDDVMSPDCLATLLDATRDGHRFALAWHDYRFESEVEEKTRSFYEELATLRTVLPQTRVTPEALCEAVLGHWCRNFLGPTSASFIHRDCFARYGPFSSEIVTFPDLEYWIRVGSNEGLAIADRYLVTFRVHGKSISAGLRDNSAAIYRNALERVLVCVGLAFAPEYTRMRGYLRAQTPALDPMKMLTREAKGARWLAIDARHRTQDQDPLLLERWND